MYEYLQEHPEIFMSERKEPNFMCFDLDSGSYLDSLSFVRDESAYLSLFSKAPLDARRGEGSTWYLYSTVAAAEIRHRNPDARIIIMLRDPVEMLYSLHGRRVFGGSEDISDFAEALAAEDDRRAGRRIPARARNIKAFFYHDVARYSVQVERYLDTFDRDRIHVVIFEELRADPAHAYAGVLRFLGVDDAVKPALGVVNASVSRRSARLRQLMLSPSVVRLGRAVIPVRYRSRVGPMVDSLTSREAPRAPLDPTVRAQLKAELRPDVLRLGPLIGVDVASLWGY
jgi:hypothetical protein